MVHSSEAHTRPMAEFVPELDRLAADAMADWKVPGAALAVVQDGKVALAKAYGQRDVEANLPVTTATQFLICSITKSFTATGVALLHNEGRLDWTKPVRDYIPEFRLHDAVATERVTVRDLLCHQSGLPRHDWVHLPGDRLAADFLGIMPYLELSRDIRAAYQYNNLCYNVLGLLIERLSGQSYQAFTRTRLTDRLGMTVSFTLEELEASADAARPYMMHEDTRLPALRLPIRTLAGGAINTSVTDLASWMRLHLGKGEFEGERLLPAALVGELHAPRVYNTTPGYAEFGEAHYGLGFQCFSYRGDRLVQHSGGWTGWGTLMTLVPDFGIGVAVLTNRSPSEVPPTLTWHIIDRLRGREPVDWRERSRKRREDSIAHMQADKTAREKARHMNTRPAHELSDYAGDYRASGLRQDVDQGAGWDAALVVARHVRDHGAPPLRDVCIAGGAGSSAAGQACHHLPDGSRGQHCQSLDAARADGERHRVRASCGGRLHGPGFPRTVRRQFQGWCHDALRNAGYGRPDLC